MSELPLPRFRIGPWLDKGWIPWRSKCGDGPRYYVVCGVGVGFNVIDLTTEDSERLHYRAASGCRFAPILRDEPRANTVRVRIAVAVTADDWDAFGCGFAAEVDRADADAKMIRELAGLGHTRISFIEADVPKPEAPRTVEGEVADVS